MKKFISMVMAAAMVVSLVPATAFAAGNLTATAKVIDEIEWSETEAEVAGGKVGKSIAPEVRYEITGAEYKGSNAEYADLDITLTLDNAVFLDGNGVALDDADETQVLKLSSFVAINDTDVTDAGVGTAAEGRTIAVTYEVQDDSEIEFNFKGQLLEDDVISFNLISLLDDTDEGTVATVTVDSDLVTLEDAAYASVLEEGITVSLKKVAEVAEEDNTELEKDLKIEANVGKFADNQKVELKLSNGFEFFAFSGTGVAGADGFDFEEDEAWFYINGSNVEKVTIPAANIKVEAVDAKVGDVATITVKVKDNVTNGFKATAEAVDAVVVIGDTVTMSVDEDDDVPVIYSGVGTGNHGINDDSNHKGLKVTLEESLAEALNTKKAFTLTLPEGVFVTDVDVTGSNNELGTNEALEAAFKAAYEKGEYECFEFKRNAFTKTDAAFEFDFTMTLVAVPGFVGDVTLTLGGDAFDEEQEVVIAEFVAPYTVEASQNDLVIDYRNTEVPTAIVVKEAEAGLWDAGKMSFEFAIDRLGDNYFEGDAVYTVNEDDSDMEITEAKSGLGFTVKEESEDEAAVVTIDGIELYMSRQLPAGAYDLEMGTESAWYLMTTNKLFTAEKGADNRAYYIADVADWKYDNGWVKELATVKEGFVNIVTAGRDADDASFTTKVVVPVGESYMVAGENTVALDVPAYVSAAGYTMLPVRAVAVALGIHNNNVLWDQATKTVTILYGQRIITMTVGAKAINVNGSAIPASASPEVVDGRTFLPMRDLATALGVTDITWDAATKTATLNGNK